jgi:transposase
LKLWRETGDVVNRQPGKTSRGRLRALDREDIDCLLRLVKQNPDYFLDELMHLLKTNRFISVHFTSIFCELERAGLSYKKLKRIAKERNENLRAEFIARMAQYDPTELGFVDECRGWGRDLHRFCGFQVVVLKFLIFAVVIFFFMTLLLLFNLDVIFTGIKVAVVI